jgi:hypothetical protein
VSHLCAPLDALLDIGTETLGTQEAVEPAVNGNFARERSRNEGRGFALLPRREGAPPARVASIAACHVRRRTYLVVGVFTHKWLRVIEGSTVALT